MRHNTVRQRWRLVTIRHQQAIMDTTIIVAIIAGATSIVVAALSFYLTKRAERKDALQQRKLEHYRELLAAISDLAVDGVDKEKAKQRFARAANMILLVAHPKVINALTAFHDEMKFSNAERSAEGHDKKLKELLEAMRWSLELPFEAEPFDFHLIGSRPKQGMPNKTLQPPSGAQR